MGSILGLKIDGATISYSLLPHLTAFNWILHLTRHQLNSEKFVPHSTELGALKAGFRKNPAPQTMDWHDTSRF